VTASAGGGIHTTTHGYDGDGAYTVIAAAIVALTLGVFSPRPATARVLLALGLAVAAISAYNVLHASQKAHDILARSSGVTTTVGVGLVLSAVVAILIVAGSVVAVRDTSSGPTPSPH
jgi:hypothetical protein